MLTTTPWGPVKSSLEAVFRPISLRTDVRAQEERSSRRGTASTQRARLVPRPHRAPPGDARAHFVGTLCHGRASSRARRGALRRNTASSREASEWRPGGGWCLWRVIACHERECRVVEPEAQEVDTRVPAGCAMARQRSLDRRLSGTLVGLEVHATPDPTTGERGLCRAYADKTPRSFLRRAPTRQGELGVAKSSVSIWVRGLGPPRASSAPARMRGSHGTAPTSSRSCGNTRASTAESEIRRPRVRPRRSQARTCTQLAWNACSLATIDQEIGECQVRCANCHRRMTAMRADHFRFRVLSSLVPP